MEYLHQDKTEKIIQAFFKVYNPNFTTTWGTWRILENLKKSMENLIEANATGRNN